MISELKILSDSSYIYSRQALCLAKLISAYGELSSDTERNKIPEVNNQLKDLEQELVKLYERKEELNKQQISKEEVEYKSKGQQPQISASSANWVNAFPPAGEAAKLMTQSKLSNTEQKKYDLTWELNDINNRISHRRKHRNTKT